MGRILGHGYNISVEQDGESFLYVANEAHASKTTYYIEGRTCGGYNNNGVAPLQVEKPLTGEDFDRFKERFPRLNAKYHPRAE